MTEKEASIAFSCFPQIGPARFKLFCQYFGSALNAWSAPIEEYKKIGLSIKILDAFAKFRKQFVLSKYLESLEKYKIRAITSSESEYPNRLRGIQDAPYLLYARGNYNLEQMCEISVAVVGTRKMTTYGRDMTEKFVVGLVDNSVAIVSGLALGIDSIAHKTAIDNNGTTVAVLGNGLDTIYPPRNRQLGEEILKRGGAIISEYPLGFPAMPQNFPFRNRIVSGVSLGVLVIEGSEKSGTLLTASSAANQGREVFAVPGSVNSPMSWVPHHLIRNGAKLVESVDDILNELEVHTKSRKQKAKLALPQTEEEQKIWEILAREGLNIDGLVRISGLSIGMILATLTRMELKGMVKNVGGVYRISN